MSKAVFLTIGIPTFMRERSLSDLLLQISRTRPAKLCEVIVINNGPQFDGDINVSLLEDAGYLVNIIQNRRNCGGQENVIRVFENALGEYIWCLGDDDRLFDDSIAKVIECLVNNSSDCLLFDANAAIHTCVKLGQGYHCSSTIFGGSIPLRKLMFVPLAVFRASSIAATLPLTRLYLGCFAPVVLLMIVGNIKTFFYLKETIISCEEVPVEMEQRLSILPVFLGIGRLAECPVSRSLNKKLLKLLHEEHAYFFSPRVVITAILASRIQSNHSSIELYIKAGFRNYPWWLAILFAFVLMGIAVVPRRILRPLLNSFCLKILKKNFNVDRGSLERI